MSSHQAVSNLFTKFPVQGVFDKIAAYSFNDVDEIDERDLVTTSSNDLLETIWPKYVFDFPAIDEAAISTRHESKVQEQNDGYGRTIRADFDFYIFEIPFLGVPAAFDWRPTTMNLTPPMGRIRGQTVEIEFSGINADSSTIARQFQQSLGQIKQYLKWLEADIEKGLTQCQAQILERIEHRKRRIHQKESVLAGLGYPVKRRDDAPRIAIPLKRKVIVKPPRDPANRQTIEPYLLPDAYEAILDVCFSMSLLIERNPTTFARLDEEVLRDHFLLQLNGQFEGAATGETFNAHGKTDILIRVDNKNIFAAECKFWSGPKSLTKAIDQLFSYLTWRDSKAAILLFSRNVGFSQVLADMRTAIESHPQFLQSVPVNLEHCLRAAMKRPDDPSRIHTLTVLPFDLSAGR